MDDEYLTKPNRLVKVLVCWHQVFWLISKSVTNLTYVAFPAMPNMDKLGVNTNASLEVPGAGDVSASPTKIKSNFNFMRKIPKDAEASNILIGEMNELDKSILAFIRLSESSYLGDLTEVPLPTRFLFILLGPQVITPVSY